MWAVQEDKEGGPSHGRWRRVGQSGEAEWTRLFALVCDLHSCFFPAALGGMGVQARAGRAGEEGGVAGHPGRAGEWAQSWLQGSGSTSSLALLMSLFLLPCSSPLPSSSTRCPWSQGCFLQPLKQGCLTPNPMQQGYGGRTGTSPVWGQDREELGRGLPRKRVGRERTAVPEAGPQLRPGTPAFLGGGAGLEAQSNLLLPSQTYRITRTL